MCLKSLKKLLNYQGAFSISLGVFSSYNEVQRPNKTYTYLSTQHHILLHVHVVKDSHNQAN